jgi:hypothetical protein
VDGRHSTEEHETHIKTRCWWLSPPLYRFLCPSPSLSRQSGGRFLLIAGTSLQQPGHGTAADQHCQQTVTPYLVRPPTVSSPVLSCLVCIPVDVRMCTVHVACCMVRAASGDSGYCTLVPIPLPQTIRCAVLWSCLIAAALPSSLPPPSLPPCFRVGEQEALILTGGNSQQNKSKAAGRRLTALG